MPVQHHMWGMDVLEALKRDPVQKATCNALVSLSHHATNVREAGSPAQDGAVPVSTYGDRPLSYRARVSIELQPLIFFP